MIQFVKQLNPNLLRMAFNNDVVRFKSSLTTTPEYAEITINPGTTVRLYPSPTGWFYFNFKPYMSVFINTDDFADTVQPGLTAEDAGSFVYSAANRIATPRIVTFTVYYASGLTDAQSYTLSWLAAVQQPGNYITYSANELIVLSPPMPDATNIAYLKYWEGYPFDVSLYSPGGEVTINNLSNGISQSFSLIGYGDRLYFSDGRTTETLEDQIPLIEGHNRLRLILNEQSTENAKFIVLEKAPPCTGVYLKWLNALGGYSYWLFENTYAIDRSTKQLGEIDRDFENPDTAFARSIQTGREVQDTLKIVAELLTPPQRDIVQNLLESPKVYLFTGAPYSRSSPQSWTEVTVKTTSARIKNPRESLTNFAFDIELPVRYTQVL